MAPAASAIVASSQGVSPIRANGVLHEGSWYGFPPPGKLSLSAPIAESVTELAALPLQLNDDLEQGLHGVLEHFWSSLSNGATPNIAVCELARDHLVAELTQKADQLYYVGQLRLRDRFTHNHTLHVAALSVALAIKAGMNRRGVRDLGLAAILHDLGKLEIPRSIMFKPGRLSETEFDVMKLHPEIGYNIIRSQLHLPEHIALPALEHQEMWSGGGYPNNRRGNEIHIFSQIVKIADVYDALTAVRPYKDGLPHEKALAIMTSEGEKSFNPELLDVFCKLGG